MVANVHEGQRVLDIAGGTGDLALAFAKKVGPTGLRGAHRHQRGHAAHRPRPPAGRRRRPADAGVRRRKAAVSDDHFDVVSVAFGLRNMTHKDLALPRCAACSSRAASCWCWSFPKWPSRWKRPTTGIPSSTAPLGKLVAGDAASYRYLAESIRMHPGQQELKALMKQTGFGHVDYHNLTGGVVALHVGIKC
jgi:demethylmenaquinone methyltransferase/2-methoxy-6-polyprenyl-1,4-benzoquinol methylase